MKQLHPATCLISFTDVSRIETAWRQISASRMEVRCPTSRPADSEMVIRSSRQNCSQFSPHLSGWKTTREPGSPFLATACQDCKPSTHLELHTLKIKHLLKSLLGRTKLGHVWHIRAHLVMSTQIS